MKTIHKQVLAWNGSDEVEIEVPAGSHHLDIQMQGKHITVWYVCDPKEQLVEKLTFRVVGTGWELPDDFVQNHYWLKTIQTTGHDEHGPLNYVWHIFLKRAYT